MRIPKYLSPSSLAKFYSNTEDFYIRYLSEISSARSPQQSFMAVGSGFDAFVKHQIHRDVFGLEATVGSQFDFEALFENQVEAHARDDARARAADIWEQYVESGAYGALRDDVLGSDFAPQMEFRIEKTVEGVPLLGLPDLRFIDRNGVHQVCDFKVNGSTSKTGASPFAGFAIAWDAHGSKTHGKCHPKFVPHEHNGLVIEERYLEDKCDYWADQLATYAWLLDEKVGSERFVVRMEQICCRPIKTREFPRCKFATHLNRVSRMYQLRLLQKYQHVWDTIQSGHIFTRLSREESDELCVTLDKRCATPTGIFPWMDICVEKTPRFFK